MSVFRWVVEKQRASQEQAVHMAGPQQKRNLQSLYETLPSPHKAKHNEKKKCHICQLGANENNLLLLPKLHLFKEKR